MQNRYPLWKYLLMIGLFVFGLLYALPNLYGEDPSVQISTSDNQAVLPQTATQIQRLLQATNLPFLDINDKSGSILIRFANTDTQLKARDTIKQALGDEYIVALNLASRTPNWLQSIGAYPMKLGLDLRGGVHFLLDVDTDQVLKARQEGDMNTMGSDMREQNIRYAALTIQPPSTIQIAFRNEADQNKAYAYLAKRYSDYLFTQTSAGSQYFVNAALTDAAKTTITNYAVDQNMSILTNRVNELGVSEAVVQRQGSNQISVDLPGVQDTTRAKDIIGKTATLRFQMVNIDADAGAAAAGNIPLGDQLYQYNKQAVLLKNQVILRGSSITYASAMMGEDGRPAVQIRLGGGSENLFYRVTAENIGKPMAVVYVETKSDTQTINGKPLTTRKQIERIISVATIRSALGNSFQIQGLDSMQYAQNLALLLRSGALTAPVDIVQERTIGPSLGAANIDKGVKSVIIGSLAVIIFMLLYYRLFGLVADIALLLNIVFIIAILSVLGATLTLPGIAGIVLTVGMAVDANVLINERIREELRLGNSPQASINAGYERAFATIVDANVTTLIVAIVLFALGSVQVRSFAITLTIGILTSMVTAIFFTRGIINLIYGRRRVKNLSIGIKLKTLETGKA